MHLRALWLSLSLVIMIHTTDYEFVEEEKDNVSSSLQFFGFGDHVSEHAVTQYRRPRD